MKSAIRVLIQQTMLPPYRLAFYQQLTKQPELQVTIAHGKSHPNSALVDVDQPKDLSILKLTNHFYGSPNPKIIWQAKYLPLLSSKEYDVVISEFNPRIVSNILGYYKARRNNLKFIWWGHGIRPNSGRADKKIYKSLSAHADAMIFYTPQGANEFIEWGMAKERTFATWNSLETELIKSFASHQYGAERHRILCIGRLLPEKKADLLLAGFHHALPHLPTSVTLTFIGDGPLYSKLQSEIVKRGLCERVKLVKGMYQQQDLAPYFNEAFVSVSPGYVGLSAIHSLAFGVPMLVAEGEPHSPEILAIKAGENAEFFPQNNVEILAQKLCWFADNDIRVRQMGQSGQKIVQENFSIESMVAGFCSAIHSVMESKNR